MTRPTTLRALLETGAENAPAILAPGRRSLSFAALRGVVDDTGTTLKQLGIRRGERIAMVLPNGPEMAAGFIAVGCHNAVAPLNPAYRKEDFEFYLSDLGAAAVVLEKGVASPAADAANQLGIRIIDLATDDAHPAGTFSLAARLSDLSRSPPRTNSDAAHSRQKPPLDTQSHQFSVAENNALPEPSVGQRGRLAPGLHEDRDQRLEKPNFKTGGKQQQCIVNPTHYLAERTDHQHTKNQISGNAARGEDFPTGDASHAVGPADVALILHTSGTTSRPKIVPLTHRNLCASAHNIAKTLKLNADDRCLNVMPLFHIHGLMAALLASLSSGGSVFAAPGFDALRFFGWFKEARPSWITAVPTMHQAILRRAKRNRAAIENSQLRFLRSASSPLPPQVFAELESTFGVPVVEAYAMTEAAHQMTSNPLPPGERIPGTVGLAAGPEVAIMDEGANRLLGTGKVGEVVIRGENVMAGYEANPEANAKAFADDWLRTGDQGVMDSRGYLTITGRLKEIINRGGEKISPREVDEALMDHPAIAQAVTFAMAHDTLGEEVAAAVVLREGANTGRTAIRTFAAERLAAFKVPRHVVFVDEIPKGATGKVQRIGLVEKLGLAKNESR